MNRSNYSQNGGRGNTVSVGQMMDLMQSEYQSPGNGINFATVLGPNGIQKIGTQISGIGSLNNGMNPFSSGAISPFLRNVMLNGEMNPVVRGAMNANAFGQFGQTSKEDPNDPTTTVVFNDKNIFIKAYISCPKSLSDTIRQILEDKDKEMRNQPNQPSQPTNNNSGFVGSFGLPLPNIGIPINVVYPRAQPMLINTFNIKIHSPSGSSNPQKDVKEIYDLLVSKYDVLMEGQRKYFAQKQQGNNQTQPQQGPQQGQQQGQQQRQGQPQGQQQRQGQPQGQPQNSQPNMNKAEMDRKYDVDRDEMERVYDIIHDLEMKNKVYDEHGTHAIDNINKISSQLDTIAANQNRMQNEFNEFKKSMQSAVANPAPQ